MFVRRFKVQTAPPHYKMDNVKHYDLLKMVWRHAINSVHLLPPKIFVSPVQKAGYDVPKPTSNLLKHLLRHLLECKALKLT